jgi:hypothetical protein
MLKSLLQNLGWPCSRDELSSVSVEDSVKVNLLVIGSEIGCGIKKHSKDTEWSIRTEIGEHITSFSVTSSDIPDQMSSETSQEVI